jgi:hypothetical protein
MCNILYKHLYVTPFVYQLRAVELAWLCTLLMKIPHLRNQTTVDPLEFLSRCRRTGKIETTQLQVQAEEPVTVASATKILLLQYWVACLALSGGSYRCFAARSTTAC